MCKIRNRIKDIVKELAKAGITDVVIEVKKHLKVTVGTTKTKKYFTGKTPSCSHSLQNFCKLVIRERRQGLTA